MLKPSHFKTPRQMRDCLEGTRLATEKVNTAGDWIMALCIGALIGLMFGLGV